MPWQGHHGHRGGVPQGPLSAMECPHVELHVTHCKLKRYGFSIILFESQQILVQHLLYTLGSCQKFQPHFSSNQYFIHSVRA